MKQVELEEILKGCKSGDRKAQKWLYDHFADEMFGTCLYYSKDYTEAEDTFHEGFMKVFLKIDQFESKGSLAGWIKRIMINTALEKFRKQYPLYATGDEIEEEHDIDPERVISDLTASDIVTMIQGLPPKYKMVFNLYAIDGYSHKEIGEMLNITEGTSKSNLSRARNILQKRVKQEYYKSTLVKKEVK
ncbi:MAG: RNA polymerase sigma factor [Bacteroidales bacterium]